MQAHHLLPQQWRWGILSVLLLFSLLGPGPIAWAQQAYPDSVKVQELLQLGHKLLTEDQLDSASSNFLQAATLSRKIGYSSGITNALRGQILVLDRQGNYKEALDIALEAIDASKGVNQFDLATSYNYAGNLYQNLGDLEAAASSYLLALKIAEELGNTKSQRKFGNNLAGVFGQLGQFEKCFQYASASYALAKQDNDSLGMANCLSNMAFSQVGFKKYDDAARYYLEELRLAKQLKDTDLQLDAINNLADVEIDRNNYQTALAYYQQGLQVLHYYPMTKYEMFMYWGMSRAYFKLNMMDQAEYYLTKSIELAQTINVALELKNIYALGFNIYEQLNKPEQALEYRKKYQLLNDSLLNAQTQQSIHRMEIEYQTSQKEKEIAQQDLLLAQNHLEIEKKNNQIYLSLAAVIALLSAMLLFYMRYQSKQRVNAQRLQALRQESELKVLMAMIEGEEKERSRLARELHDGVGGILSATKMHLSVLKNEAALSGHQHQFEHTSSMLDNASQEVRTIAHNLSPDMLLRYELDQALANFCKSVSNAQLQVDFYYLGEPLRLKNNFKLVLYRMVQELVNNIIKHAAASQALVQLSHHQQVLSLTVEDNGVGFEEHQSKGIGLANLKNRVKDMQGELSIESAPGRGTTVYAEFDLTPYLEKDTPSPYALVP